jgi:hypothetical protein
MSELAQHVYFCPQCSLKSTPACVHDTDNSIDGVGVRLRVAPFYMGSRGAKKGQVYTPERNNELLTLMLQIAAIIWFTVALHIIDRHFDALSFASDIQFTVTSDSAAENCSVDCVATEPQCSQLLRCSLERHYLSLDLPQSPP